MAGVKSDKVWHDAIKLAVKRYHEEKDEKGKKKKQKYINILASKLVSKATDGDVSALKEIGDRLDGKATQPIGNAANVPLEVIFRHVNLDDDD